LRADLRAGFGLLLPSTGQGNVVIKGNLERRDDMTKKSNEHASLYALAHTAGHNAACACQPTPMFLGEEKGLFSGGIDYSKPTYFVSDGVCGFAWIKIAGNTSFGKWAKKAGVAKSAYGSGLQIWVKDYGQSMQRKEAYAQAFALALKEVGGIDAYADSRMD
jgi:hypothetical protein